MSKYHIIYKNDRDNFIQEYNDYLDNHSSDEVRPSQLGGYLADCLDKNESAVLATPKNLFAFPNRISGVMIRVSSAENESGEPIRMNGSIAYSYEADFLLRLIKGRDFLIKQFTEYEQSEPGDGNYREFTGIFDKRWYIDDLKDYLIPMLSEYQSEGDIPYIVQHYAIYYIKCRLIANQNNANRHILTADNIDLLRTLFSQALKYIDDKVIMEVFRYPAFKRDFQMNRMLLRLKYEKEKLTSKEGVALEGFSSGDSFGEYDLLDIYYLRNIRYPALFVVLGDIPIYSTSQLRCNIQFIDIRDGRMEIDGSFPDIFDKDEVEYVFRYKDMDYRPVWCERYSLTKYFGESAYKRYTFHVTIPLDKPDSSNVMKCFIVYKDSYYEIAFEYKSHTSRLAAYPMNTYWHSGEWLLTTDQIYTEAGGHIATGIRISPYRWHKMALKELGIGMKVLWLDMKPFRQSMMMFGWLIKLHIRSR